MRSSLGPVGKGGRHDRLYQSKKAGKVGPKTASNQSRLLNAVVEDHSLSLASAQVNLVAESADSVLGGQGRQELYRRRYCASLSDRLRAVVWRNAKRRKTICFGIGQYCLFCTSVRWRVCVWVFGSLFNNGSKAPEI
jgi:hypothetical protein